MTGFDYLKFGTRILHVGRPYKPFHAIEGLWQTVVAHDKALKAKKKKPNVDTS